MTNRHDQAAITEPQRKTVFVIEDDQEIGESFVMFLQLETPYRLVLVPDGLQALALMRSIKPDLIITDYSLPGMDGIALYDHLKSLPALAAIPVLLVSARLPVEETLRRNLPYLWKPLDVQQLLDTIHQLLS